MVAGRLSHHALQLQYTRVVRGTKTLKKKDRDFRHIGKKYIFPTVKSTLRLSVFQIYLFDVADEILY